MEYLVAQSLSSFQFFLVTGPAHHQFSAGVRVGLRGNRGRAACGKLMHFELLACNPYAASTR
jgi:hypothetical protein